MSDDVQTLIEPLRERVGGYVRSTLGLRPDPRRLRALAELEAGSDATGSDATGSDATGLATGTEPVEAAAPARRDRGLFGPGSATWKVHGSPAGLVGGLRALLLQTMHPLAMAGVAQHSNYRADPFGRLQRTSAFVAATTYGTVAEAERAIEVVHRVHERVTGTAPDGRPYRANDPELLLWVHATEIDSFLRAHLRFDPDPLDAAGIDRYVEEMADIAHRLGSAPAPLDRAQLRAYFERVRPELRAGRHARETARFLLVPPIPNSARPAYGIVAAAAVGLLPTRVRRALWIPPLLPGMEPLLVRPAATALLRTLAWALAPPPELTQPSGGAAEASTVS
ncbi:MAG: DUF2236 domain-containing protein [Acidimicrobiia bacterium]|nr:DUF2236 domain-containing protein [Acidimicrobiia bacterium]